MSTKRNNSNSFDRRPLKMTKKEAAKNHRRIRDFDNDNNEEQDNRAPHAGSYATAALRKRFGIKLEDFDNDADVEHTKTNGFSSENKAERKDNGLSKKKVALFLGFLGTRYGGFQVNEGQRTIQAEIELALFRCGMISKTNFGFPFKYSWSSSARTDKGVHACSQVCSVKLELPEEYWEDSAKLDEARQKVEDKLPIDIKVLDIVRTTRNFCAKTQRDRVRYQYMIPAFLLHPDWRGVLAEHSIDVKDRLGRENLKAILTEDEMRKLQNALQGYRTTEESKKLLQTALRKYEGTKYYHNFTRGLGPGQAQAQRYIQYFNVEDPVIIDDMEWLPTQVLGQSFLLHQIRKMISVAVDVARKAVPLEFMDQALSKKEVFNINVAPAQGLFLEMSYYGGYNRRKQQNSNLADLDWSKEGPAKTRWSDFRDVVRRHIFQEEKEQGNFIQYMPLQEYIYNCRKMYGINQDKGADEMTKKTGAAEDVMVKNS